jgi:hypothetical protein
MMLFLSIHVQYLMSSPISPMTLSQGAEYWRVTKQLNGVAGKGLGFCIHMAGCVFDKTHSRLTQLSPRQENTLHQVHRHES